MPNNESEMLILKLMRPYILLIAAAVLFMACGNKKNATADQRSAKSEMTEQPEAGYPAIVMMQMPMLDAGDPYNFEKVELNGDFLELIVSYGGGCKEHDFVLQGDPRIMKSLPPQMNIVLVHNANQDNCRAYITDTLRYDLKPVRIGEEGTIVLRLFNTEERLTYTY